MVAAPVRDGSRAVNVSDWIRANARRSRSPAGRDWRARFFPIGIAYSKRGRVGVSS
jgi:hypothetical protein